MSTSRDPEWLVACLCAAWCGTCRAYRDGFEALAEGYPDAAFHWVDIEDDTELLGDDLDVEDFPTLLIQRGELVLFFGPMLPQHGHLERTLEAFAAMDADEARAYAAATPERRSWQAACNLRPRLARR